MKKAILALLVFVAAGTALGDLSKYKDWAKSPEAYFLTPPEREEWAKIKSDEDAEKFIQLYWAKREGGPASKQEVMRRIDAADLPSAQTGTWPSHSLRRSSSKPAAARRSSSAW